jgi:serine/threonine protein kinase
LAPEVILNVGHNQASDHWSLGIVIYEMVCGENPFYYDGIKQMKLFKLICQEQMYPLPDEASDECYDVVDLLLEKDPSIRLGSLKGKGKDIIRQAWFKELDLTLLRQKKIPAPFKPSNATLDTLIEEEGSESNFDDHHNDLVGGKPIYGTAAKGGLLDEDSDIDSEC